MGELVTELTTDFKKGMIDNTAATRFPPDALAMILNGRLEPDATRRRRGGSVRLHATALNSGAFGFGAEPFVKADGTVQVISFLGDKAYKSEDYGASWSEIASGLRTDYYDFATMRIGTTNYLFAANGDTTIKRWDGDTWDTLTNAPSGVKHLAVFNFRLWVTGHSGVLVQASKIADPTIWTTPDGLTVQILVSSGDTPTGLHQIGPHLLVFDERQTSYIDGFGEQTIIVASGATGLSRSVGCIAFRSIVAAGDHGCCWLSKRGIEYYAPGSEIQLLSRGITIAMDSVDRAALLANPGRPTAVYDETLEEYLLALSTTGTRNNLIFRFSLRQRGRDFFGAPALDQPISLTGDIVFLLASSDGYLTDGSGGFQAKSDADGYMALASTGTGGDPTSEDASGYLTTVTDDTMPATMFMAPTADHPGRVHSIGYDGFVRLHGEGDKDDVLSDGTGGVDITMTLVSRPFFLGSVRHEKKVRVVHVASINDADVSIDVGIRTKGALSELVTTTIPAGALDQSRQKRVMVHAKGVAPQVELHTTADVRITLLGISAQVRKERVS